MTIYLSDTGATIDAGPTVAIHAPEPPIVAPASEAPIVTPVSEAG
jgi:hypothetical protein